MSDTQTNHSQDPRVQAIRRHPALRYARFLGGCRVKDTRLVAVLDGDNVQGPNEAVIWALHEARILALRMSQALAPALDNPDDFSGIARYEYYRWSASSYAGLAEALEH
jgi:hypothetical protein